MSLPTYEEYRDSGVPWLGAVPLHWEVQRFKWLIERNDGGVWGDDPDGVDDTVVLRSTEQSVDGRWRIDDPAKRKLTEKDRLSALLEVGDLLLTKSSGSALHIGKTTLVDERVASIGACYSNFMQRLRVVDDFCPRLAWYILNNSLARVQLDLLSNSTTGLANLNGTIIGQLLLALPPQQEQSAIADFLDRETAKIDALISEQEKLIALVAEKRQATISHAVTRGLNPDASMKDSGLDRLGEVPAHWALPPLYLRYSAELGKMLDASRITGTHSVPYLRNVDVQWDSINLDELPCMDIEAGEYARYTVRDGDLLVCEGGEVGRAAVAFVGEAIVGFQKALHRLRAISNGEHPRYMFYTFAWAANAGAFAGEGQSTIAHLTGEQLRKYRFPKPPYEEQVEIASFLDAEMERLKELAKVAAHAVVLLKERRSALISAAVTGQIDVRNA